MKKLDVEEICQSFANGLKYKKVDTKPLKGGVDAPCGRVNEVKTK